MKRFVSRPTTTVITAKESEVPNDPIVSDISVARLIDNGLLVLYREMRQLLLLSSRGKLEPADSRDLRDTIKLLFELQARENESLQGLTDEQLQAKVKDALESSSDVDNN